MKPAISTLVSPLIAIANAYDANELDDEARKFYGQNLEHETTTCPSAIVLYSGRGGRDLLTLQDCLLARTGVATGNETLVAQGIAVLTAIADAYDANELDDEARKFYGKNLEHKTTTDPSAIELYAGRGGKCLLTLQHALTARFINDRDTPNRRYAA